MHRRGKSFALFLYPNFHCVYFSQFNLDSINLDSKLGVQCQMLIAEYPLKCSNISPISGRLKLRHSQKISIRKLRKGYHIHYMFSLWCRILADGSLLLRLIWTYCVKISTSPRLHVLYFAQAQNQNYNSVASDFLLSDLILKNRFMTII